MKKFLRFGKIPSSGKSINFFKMTNEENENFTYNLEIGEIEQAFEMVPEYAYEAGLSVFDVSDNGMPYLPNMQLITSLLGRLDDTAYIVSGQEIERGNDGEPLIVFDKIECEKNIDKKEMMDYVISILKSKFDYFEYNEEENYNSNQVFYFNANGGEWCLNGWTFKKPKNGFDATIGAK